MKYEFRFRDVPEIKRGNTWQTFATIRTQAEADRAVEFVDHRAKWEGSYQSFRITRPLPGNPFHRQTVYRREEEV